MDCPNCSQPGAKRSFFKVRCPNPACPSYDPALASRGGGFAAGSRAATPVPGTGPAESAGPEPVASKRSRSAPGAGASWILWIAAYGLFRTGQHAPSAQGVLWALAAATAIAAWLLGRRAAAPEVQEDDETRERRELERHVAQGRRDPHPAEPFDPAGARRIEIRYRNWRDRDRTFIGDRTTLRRRRQHVTVRVEPTGGRIALRVDRIANRAEVEGAIPA